MLTPARFDPGRVEPALGAQTARIEQALGPVAQGSLDPFADGDSEAGLRPLEQLARRFAVEHLPEDVLPRAAADLHAEGNARGELGHPMVEEGAMDLEADRHRGAVDLA